MESRNRRWDFHPLRLFVGSVAGSAFFAGALVSNHPLWSQARGWISAESPPDAMRFGVLLALGIAGLGYFYLASAPQVLFHALRECLGSRFLKFDFIKWILFAATLSSLLFALALFPVQQAVSGHWLRFMPFLAVVVLQMVLLSTMRIEAILAHYVRLSVKRAEALTRRIDYGLAADGERESKKEIRTTESEFIDSYRVLRDQGNLFSVVILEAVLALALGGAPSFTDFSLLILTWILPGTIAWFLGTYLELHLRDS